MKTAAEAEGEAAITEAREKITFLKCVVFICFTSKHFVAHVVFVKGDDEEHYCAKLVLSDIECLCTPV